MKYRMGCILALSLLSLRALAQQATTPKYVLYTDPKGLLQVSYPSNLFHARKEGGFVFGSSKAVLIIKVKVNEDGHSWQEEVKKFLDPDFDAVITYQAVKDHFAVISGYSGPMNREIFYEKEIPVIAEGRKFNLVFHMWFPQGKKKFFDPILEHCVNSFKPAPDNGTHRISLGWEPTEATQDEDELLDRARVWINANIKCKDYTKVEGADWDDVPSVGCTIEPDEPEMFDLTNTGKIPFVLTAYGPIVPVYLGPRSDQKFVLFSFKGGKMSKQVIYQTGDDDRFTGYKSAVDILDFPDGKKAILLSITGSQCDTSGHLFMDINGEIRDVLDFDKSYDPCRPTQQVGVQGFNGTLELIDEKHVRLLKRDYETTMKDGEMGIPANYHSSEIRYEFDPVQGIFVQMGLENELPKSVEVASITRFIKLFGPF